ncbi:lysylphosphatidylglycerol synthase transmembrane domain-containing protein [soil metagenome]
MVRSALLGGLQVLAIAVPVIAAAVLVIRRSLRLLGVSFGTAATSALAAAMVQGWLADGLPRAVAVRSTATSWVTGSAFPSGSYLAAVAAVTVVVTPMAATPWRRVMWSSVLVFALTRMVTSTATPVDLIATISLGAVVGSAVLAAIGAPRRRYPVEEITLGIRRAGVRIRDLTIHHREGATLHLRGVGSSDSGDGLVDVTFIGRDDRDAELLARLVRWLLVKGVADRRRSWSNVGRARNEALCTLLAAEGVRTSQVLGVGETPGGDAVLVLTAQLGTVLSEVDAELLDDALLAEVWTQVAALHAQRIAHGALHTGNVRIDDARASIVGFRSAEAGADDRLLAADIAEMLVSLSTIVGADRVIATALGSALHEDDLSTALPLVQPLALTTRTRRSPGVKPLAVEVHGRLQAALGVEPSPTEDLARISWSRLAGALGGFVLVGFVLTFITNAAAIGRALTAANWVYLPFVIATVFIGSFTSAWSLCSVLLRPPPFLRTAEVMMAQCVLNRSTPANAGGMALRTRYLQKNGVDLGSAAMSVGLTSAASGVVQVVLLVVLGAWVGATDAVGFSAPDASTLAVALVALAVAGCAAYATPWGRRKLVEPARGLVGEAIEQLRSLSDRPSKLFGLFGATTLGKVFGILAFDACCRAFGVSFGFPQLALLYLTAGTIGAAAPTPGGVGGIEAAYVAALTGSGVDPGAALSIVVVWRLLTYWFPVIPSWVALHHVRRIGAV